MSYDLWVWKGPVPKDEDEFIELKQRLDEGDENAFVASPDVLKFHADLLKRYPALEDLDEDKVDDSPWALTPDASDRIIEMTISWDDAEAVLKVVAKLAKQHGLLLTDAASGQIVRP